MGGFMIGHVVKYNLRRSVDLMGERLRSRVENLDLRITEETMMANGVANFCSDMLEIVETLCSDELKGIVRVDLVPFLLSDFDACCQRMPRLVFPERVLTDNYFSYFVGRSGIPGRMMHQILLEKMQAMLLQCQSFNELLSLYRFDAVPFSMLFHKNLSGDLMGFLITEYEARI